MSDIVNEYFRKFYPPDWDTNWETQYTGWSYDRRYCGDRYGPDVSVIFPRIVCGDGFSMSVQGHSGGYSRPRDDFADEYSMVEILGPECSDFGEGSPCGEEWLYGYVPVEKVIAVIEAHGGIASPPPPSERSGDGKGETR